MYEVLATLCSAELIKGEALRLIVTSVDLAIDAFAELFPFPMEARDGSRHLWGELIPGAQGRALAFIDTGVCQRAR